MKVKQTRSGGSIDEEDSLCGLLRAGFSLPLCQGFISVSSVCTDEDESVKITSDVRLAIADVQSGIISSSLKGCRRRR